MEFGKLEDISDVDWNLPEDDPSNSALPMVPHSEFFVGTPAWGVKKWVGKLYPKYTKPENFLYFYSRSFSSIELNTTHYRIPSPDKIKEWVEQVPPTFRFCPKFPKDISHSRFGITDKVLLRAWIESLVSMKDHLGTTFIQFHEKFSYEEKYFLFQFLEFWPSEFKLSIEFRHPSWFKGHSILPALSDYLRKKQIGLVITDVAGRRDVLHTTLTASWTMIRLIGNDLACSDELRLRLWANRLADWQSKMNAESYLFLHQPDDNFSLEFTQMAEPIFKEQGFDEFPKIEIIKDHDLFSSELRL